MSTNDHHIILLLLLLIPVLVLLSSELDLVRRRDPSDDTVLSPCMRVFLDRDVRVSLCVLPRYTPHQQ